MLKLEKLFTFTTDATAGTRSTLWQLSGSIFIERFNKYTLVCIFCQAYFSSVKPAQKSKQCYTQHSLTANFVLQYSHYGTQTSG
jgi:hypothetical protein